MGGASLGHRDVGRHEKWKFLNDMPGARTSSDGNISGRQNARVWVHI